MITATMNKHEVNREIFRALPDLLTIIWSKMNHRKRKARKVGYPDTSSSYKINGIDFWVFYFLLSGKDANSIFCKYYEDKRVVYAHVALLSPDQYSTSHIYKHAFDRYNERLGLNLTDIKDILLHFSRHGMVLIRQELPSEKEGWCELGWKSNLGLWLGQAQTNIEDSNLSINIIRTFVDDNSLRKSQTVGMTDSLLEKLIAKEMQNGDDEYTQIRINNLMRMFKGNAAR